jgi:hypothetical protein
MATTETFVSTLKINRLTKAQFDAITPSDEELYFLTDGQISYNDLLDKPTIGNGTLTIQKNGTTLNTFTANSTSPVTINIGVPVDVSEIASQTQMASINSGATTALISQITTNKNNITTINSKIPSEASSSNQLADKAFVNSSINAIAAYYITSDAQGDAFATKAALDAGPWYFDGATRTPTKNDYAIVIADETRSNACCRYSYTGSQWAFQYVVNDTPFTQAQLDAINSTITSALVTSYNNHIADSSIHVTTTDKNNWNNKVDKVTTTQRAYATDSSGNQTTLRWTSTAEASTLAYRNSAGNISVATPTADGHATSKKYVDDADATKVDKVSTTNQVYGTDGSGNQTTYSKDSFGKVDDVKVGTASVVTNKIANLGTMAGESTADWQQKLTAGSGIDITNNVISAENVFIADYGTTSYADVKAAYDAGYQIIVRRNSFAVGNCVYYNLIYISNSPNIDFIFAFIAVNGNSILYHSCVLSSTNGWTTNSGEYIQKQLTSLSVSEGITGTSTTQRNVQANYLKQIIQGTTLTGIVFTNTNDVTASDSITTAIGKLQANETDLRNNKQDNINDLGDIRSGAAAGATAVQPGDLATVATSGSYNDLTNKPTIGNGTLTIQKNGTTVATFTANQTGNTTANILADVINTDNTTINKNSNDALQAIGVIDKKSGNAVYDWIGTTAEYNALSSYNNDWIYYITDDNNPVLVPAVDYATVNINSGNELYAVGVKNKNTTQTATTNIYDWVGTYEEYNTQQVGVNHPDWICYITDDVNGGEDIYSKQETDELLETKQDASTALNYNYISNCITYVPQNIKLDLVNGALILRAGSKVYIPNGDGEFNTITVSEDKTATNGWGSANVEQLVFLRENSLLIFPKQYCFSGTTAPTSFFSSNYATWYDTTNNVVKFTTNAGSTWESDISLPVGIIKETTGDVISNIDQIFNGFGYVGSTVFVLPNVKYLVPNGRNTDGTLNNTAVTITSVKTRTFTDTATTDWGLGNDQSINQNPQYTLGSDNYLYANNGIRVNVCAIGILSRTNGVISSMTAKTAFQAVDASGADYVISYQRPTSANNYIWYRLYKSGWVEQGGPGDTMNKTITFPILMADTNYYTNLGFVIANRGAQNITKYTDRIVTSSSAQDSCTYGGWEVKGFAA